MKFTSLQIVSATLLAFVGSLIPVTALASGPMATATCDNVQISISMKPPVNHDHWAIRIDDRSNSFQPTDMRPGDVLIDSYTSNTYTVKGQAGEQYNWWIHSVAKDGTWSDPTGGVLNCSPKAPVGLNATYDYPTVTLSWNPVKGAVKYAIRVDNTINTWDPENMQDGDHLRNNLTENTFVFSASKNRKIVYWIHAIDKYGVWSDASYGNIVTQ